MNQGPGIMIFGLVLFLAGAALIIVPIIQAKKSSVQPQATYNQSFNDAYNQDTTNVQGPENFQ